MFHTAEVRWFGKGELPATVRSWFIQYPGRIHGLEERTDAYLLTQVDNLGIKIREGRLEIKFRTQVVGQREFHPKLAGMVENWTKVGFGEAAESIGGITLELPASHWLDVKKARLVRQFTQLDSGEIVPIEIYAEPSSPTQLDLDLDVGCSLEITEIEVPQGKWWSLALEAVGSAQRREALLIAVTKFLARTYDSPPLEVPVSYGYPYWLANL